MDTACFDDLPLGAHLTTRRRGYLHHGIYAGAGKVIHYPGFKRLFRRGPVEEVTLERFTKGCAFAIRSGVEPRFSGATAVARARSRLGENRYRVWTNNCEHFCEWCVSGESRSTQVEVLTRRIHKAFTAFGLRRPWITSETCAA
jgi:lecithin:retinol acyltransferase